MKKQLISSLPLLLVDDEPSWLRTLTVTLKSAAGINNIVPCMNSRNVMSVLAEQKIGLVLLDLTMPYLSGEELLQMISREYPQIPVIILSGMNQLETAVNCMKLGAFDYFVKTSEKERLITGIRRALEIRALREENLALQKGVLQYQPEHTEAFSDTITVSRNMHAVFKYIEAVAPSSEPLLIRGETGVGKELIAKAVHRIGRSGKPWVAVNVGGLDDSIFSDTLFGHCRGAFTGADRDRAGVLEKAQGGTLFLDEIGDLSLSSQVKLLRLLQEREFLPLGSDSGKKSTARILCATNQNLEENISTGKFRKDLYYRLSAHQVHIPPLRERPEDIPLLVQHFLREAAESLKKGLPSVPKTALAQLSGYAFPGNIRELRALIFNASSLHQTGELSWDLFSGLTKSAAHAWEASPPCPKKTSPSIVPIPPGPLPTLQDAGDLLVAEALRRSNGNITAAADILGITRQGLTKRLKKMAG